MDEIDDRGLNGDQFSKTMSNIDVHGSSKQKAGTWSSRSLGGSSTGNTVTLFENDVLWIHNVCCYE